MAVWVSNTRPPLAVWLIVDLPILSPRRLTVNGRTAKGFSWQRTGIFARISSRALRVSCINQGRRRTRTRPRGRDAAETLHARAALFQPRRVLAALQRPGAAGGRGSH